MPTFPSKQIDLATFAESLERAIDTGLQPVRLSQNRIRAALTALELAAKARPANKTTGQVAFEAARKKSETFAEKHGIDTCGGRFLISGVGLNDRAELLCSALKVEFREALRLCPVVFGEQAFAESDLSREEARKQSEARVKKISTFLDEHGLKDSRGGIAWPAIDLIGEAVQIEKFENMELPAALEESFERYGGHGGVIERLARMRTI